MQTHSDTKTSGGTQGTGGMARAGRYPLTSSRYRRLTSILVLATAWSAAAQPFTTLKSFGQLARETGLRPAGSLVQGADGTIYGTAPEGNGNDQGTAFKLRPDGTGFTVLKGFTNSLEGAEPMGGLAISGNTLYGTTESGGTNGSGTVFQVHTDGSGFAVLKHFAGTDGSSPSVRLTLADGVLYGVTQTGGSQSAGTVFRINTDGTGFSNLKTFYYTDGAYPSGALTLANGVLFGTTSQGGAGGGGTLFSLATDGSAFAVLTNFPDSGPGPSSPQGGLVLQGGMFYGTTGAGGANNAGTVYAVNADGTGLSSLLDFTAGTTGSAPQGDLALAGDTLYGTTQYGGTNDGGVVFQVNLDGSGAAVLHTFGAYSDGSLPAAGVLLAGAALFGTTVNGGSINSGTIFTLGTDGSNYAVIKSCGNSDLFMPQAALAVGNGRLFGLAVSGGNFGYGGLFSLRPDAGAYQVNRPFGGLDGLSPYGNLTVVSNVVYGTTRSGGSARQGDIFQFNTDGSGFSILRNLTAYDAASPCGGLVAVGGTLYGASTAGGVYQHGSIFGINTDGSGFTVLTSFGGSGTAPESPQHGLTYAEGVLYGTTSTGGTGGGGTVFKINVDGSGFTVLRNFATADGYSPSTLILSGSTLYGATSSGGANYEGTVFRIDTNGMNFQVLLDLDNTTGGTPPDGVALVGNTLYRTTTYGGTTGNGTVYSVNTDGTLPAVVHNFTGTGNDGSFPSGNLVQLGNTLYGLTEYGGQLNEGTLFSLPVAGIDTSYPYYGFSAARLGLPPGANPFVLAYFAPPGLNLVLSASTDLKAWIPLSTNLSTGADLVYYDWAATNYPHRFYRVQTR